MFVIDSLLHVDYFSFRVINNLVIDFSGFFFIEPSYLNFLIKAQHPYTTGCVIHYLDT